MAPKEWNGFLLAYTPPSGGIESIINVSKMKRPSFNEETRLYMYQTAPESQVVQGMTSRDDILMSTCHSCGQPAAVADMDLGHLVSWKTYLTDNNVETDVEARAAYNDINNLRLEHACCNRSHRFEKYEGPWPHPKGAEIFAAIIEDFEAEEGNTSSKHSVGRRPKIDVLLAEPIVKHEIKRKIDIDDFERPKWDKSTRCGLIQIWIDRKLVEKAPLHEGGKDYTWFQCASCRNYGPSFDMQLGHIKKWKKYLKSKKVETQAEAQWVYNDLANLQFEHSKCNMSGDWEKYDPENARFSTSGYDINKFSRKMKDFIVPVTDSEVTDWREDTGFDEYLQNYFPTTPAAPTDIDEADIQILIPRRVVSVVRSPKTEQTDLMFDSLELMPRMLDEPDPVSPKKRKREDDHDGNPRPHKKPTWGDATPNRR